jgi:hypothetical protein
MFITNETNLILVISMVTKELQRIWTSNIIGYSILLSFVKNRPIKTQFYTFVTMVSKNSSEYSTRGNRIGYSTSDPSEYF